MSNPKCVCSTCKHFESEVHYSGGEKGWCFLAGEILGIDVEYDDTCEDWEENEKTEEGSRWEFKITEEEI